MRALKACKNVSDTKMLLFSEMFAIHLENYPEKRLKILKSLANKYLLLYNGTKCENLRRKNSTSSWGGNRYSPRAFTEQGVYLLMTVLKGDLAIRQSRALVKAFKGMKDIFIENPLFLEKDGILQISMQVAGRC